MRSRPGSLGVRPADARNLAEAAAALGNGALVGVPTETVYGLAASARDPAAIARVFALKQRPTFDPLIVHLGGPGDPVATLAGCGLVDLAGFDLEGARVLRALATRGWPGPLTLVLPKTAEVPDLATSGLDTVAVRIPAHPVALALLAAAGPFVAPSANRFGRVSPTRPEHVVDELGDGVAIVLDGGPCRIGVESTVVHVAPDGALTLLRAGGTPIEDLEGWTGRVVAHPASASDAHPASPGRLASHYAPRTPLVLAEAAPRELPARAGILRFAPGAPGPWAAEEVLSPTGDLAEAARNLFSALRALDAAGLDLIVAEPPPTDEGLGRAIRDRLERASVRP